MDDVFDDDEDDPDEGNGKAQEHLGPWFGT